MKKSIQAATPAKPQSKSLPRKLSRNEMTWLKRAIQNADASKSSKQRWRVQIPDLLVHYECNCGESACKTIMFVKKHGVLFQRVGYSTHIVGVGLVVLHVHPGTDYLLELEII